MANVWLYGEFTEEDRIAISDIEEIKDVERRLVLDAVGDFEGSPSIALNFIEQNIISKSYLVEGEEFDIDKDGIWLDKRFADARNLTVGDSISVSYNGFRLEKEIKGIIYSPDYVYMSDDGGLTNDFSKKGYAYLSYQQFPQPEHLVFTQIIITSDVNDYDALEEKISDVINGKYSVFLTREQNESALMFQQEIEQHKSIGQLFPVIFVAIALLTMLTTMTRLVNNQRTQIGTLKALGFKKRKITAHYVGYGFWLSLIGSILGAITGPLVLPPLFYPSMSSFYTLPEWKPIIDISFYIMAAITVVACTLVTYLSCRQLLKDTPASALRPKAPKVAKHSSFEKTKLWKKLGFNMQWNLRDITRNRIRSIMAVAGTFGCTALLVFAFNMKADMDDLKEWQYEDINKFESKLLIDSMAAPEQIQDVLNRVDGEMLMEGSIEVKANGTKKTTGLTVNDNVTLINNTDKNREYMKLPAEGVSLSYKMAKMVDVKIGDEITWHIYGDEKWNTSTVEEIYRSPSGQGIILEREYFEKLGYTFVPTSIVTTEYVSEDYDGIQSVMHTSDLTDSWDDLTEAMMIMVYLVIAAAAVLAIVVLYNLGILSYTEMEREFATLKVVGFKAKKIRHLLLTQNLLLSIIGFILGIPVGLWLVEVMASGMGDAFDMMIVLHLTDMLYTGIIVFLLSFVVNLMFSRKIKHLDMVSALKGVE